MTVIGLEGGSPSRMELGLKGNERVVTEPQISGDGRFLAVRFREIGANYSGGQGPLALFDLESRTRTIYGAGCMSALSPDGQWTTNNFRGHNRILFRNVRTREQFQLRAADCVPEERRWDSAHWSNHPRYFAIRGDGRNWPVYVAKFSPDPKEMRFTRVIFAGGRCEYPDLFCRRDKVTGKVFGESAPRITRQPSDATVEEGATATFTVAASAAPEPKYQWYLNGEAVHGATSASCTVTGSRGTNGARYHCVVTNPKGKARSEAATLTVELRGPSPEAVAAWEGKLIERARAALRSGRDLSLNPESRRNRRRVVAVDERGTLRVEVVRGMVVTRAWSRVSAADKTKLALAVLRDESPGDHALVAFFMLAEGDRRAAAGHLAQAGELERQVREAFE
jgi:hypothetical protein